MGEAIHAMQPQCMQRNYGLISGLLPGLLLTHFPKFEAQLWKEADIHTAGVETCSVHMQTRCCWPGEVFPTWIKVAAAIVSIHQGTAKSSSNWAPLVCVSAASSRPFLIISSQLHTTSVQPWWACTNTPLPPRINLQELPGFPETLPSFQDKSCNIVIGKLVKEISVNSLNWIRFF